MQDFLSFDVTTRSCIVRQTGFVERKKGRGDGGGGEFQRFKTEGLEKLVELLSEFGRRIPVGFVQHCRVYVTC
jgi:hypothetical protein